MCSSQDCGEEKPLGSNSSQCQQHEEARDRVGVPPCTDGSHNRVKQPAAARQQKCMQRILVVAARVAFGTDTAEGSGAGVTAICGPSSALRLSPIE